MNIAAFCTSVSESRVARVVKSFHQSAIVISGIVIILSMVAMVLLRYVFKLNLFGMDEIILTFIFWFYFFGGVNGSMEDSQIRADIFSVFVKNGRFLWAIRLITRVIEIVVLCFLIYMTVQLLVTNFERMPTTQGLKIPYVIPQLAIGVGFVLMLFYSVGHLLTMIANPPTEKGIAENPHKEV
jgi:TRAP-type C4-dicarboxylate transport system permease small subunit